MDPRNKTSTPRRPFWHKATTAEKIALVIGVLYLVSPVDLVPEALLGPLGLLDDGGVAITMLLRALKIHARS